MKTKISRRFLSLFVVLAMMLSLATTASAKEYSTGAAPFDPEGYDDVHFTVIGYLEYSNNTTESITVDRMGVFALNRGEVDLQYVYFRAVDGKGMGQIGGWEGDWTNPEIAPIKPGQSSVYYVPAWGLLFTPSTYQLTYPKYGSCAAFDITASPGGDTSFGLTTILSHPNSFSWYKTSRTNTVAQTTAAQTEITFSAPDKAFLNDTVYSLDTMRASGEPMFVEVKAPVILNKEDGTEHSLTMQAFENGEAVYAIDAAGIDAEELEIRTPVFYVEQDVAEINVPLDTDGRSRSLLSATVSETQDLSHLEDGHLVIDFTTADDSCVPFDMVLVSNGKEYNNFSTQYFFDSETGRFTNGQLVFNDLMANDLSADAHFVVSSVYVRYCPEEFVVSR